MKELGVSLLFLMWRAHQCWDKMCWDLVKDTTKGEKTLEARTSLMLALFILTAVERRNHRMKDFVFLHNQLHPADKHVRKLTPQVRVLTDFSMVMKPPVRGRYSRPATSLPYEAVLQHLC